MSETTFRFRQFLIRQDKSAMKVSTDAVLLGSWVNPSYCKRILDIGTGTGVIAIMLAQKCEANIVAIDIDQDSAMQAKDNVEYSPWPTRIEVIHDSLQHFSNTGEKTFDLIVSNPPYFEHSLNLNTDPRSTARHTHTLSFPELIHGVKVLLSEKGKFCMIMPSSEGNSFISLAYREGLFCREKMHVFTKKGKPEKRLLMQFTRDAGTCAEKELIMLDEKMNYTEEFKKLTWEYYPDPAELKKL